MRAAASAVMAVLVVAALLAGNCFSCPQMLLAMAAHQPAHGCCHHGKTHTQNADCHTQALRHFVKADGSAQVTPAVVNAVVAVPVPLPAIAADSVATPVPVDHAPPTQVPLRI
jgi:hypothetical protein